jgi:hypothetical protein
MNDPTEKQIVHDWSTGELVIYEIDAPVTEISTPEEIAQLPTRLVTDETPTAG